MKQFTIKELQNQMEGKQMIDLRSQKAFQMGHLRGALNLNPNNLIKYGKQFLDGGKELIFLVGAEESERIDQLEQRLSEAGITNISGYIIAEEIPQEDQEITPTISVEEFMDLEEDYLLLDLRHPNEITRPAPEKNGINIPLEELVENSGKLETEQPIYLLCGSGNRATAAASYLKNEGYQSIVLEGGMGAVEQFRNRNN